MRFTKTIAAVLCAFAIACGGRNNEAMNGQPAPSDGVLVSVENNNWQEVAVYAERAGSRTRLGTVQTGKKTAFMLPADYVFTSDFRIMVDPIGGTRQYVSQKLLVNRGDVVDVRVENSLPQSVTIVR